MRRLITIITYCLLTGCCCIVLLTYTKEYSYEGSPPTQTGSTQPDTANFTLVGAPADCSVTLPPSYLFAGDSINQTSINISVDVTRTGDYSISTDTLDNIYFS